MLGSHSGPRRTACPPRRARPSVRPAPDRSRPPTSIRSVIEGWSRMEALGIAFAVSFGVVFVAELGDKSQLMALTFAARYRALPVLVGITIATSVVHLISVAVGYGLGTALP